jgi:tetratricopeptide (TPR) repeat protein
MASLFCQAVPVSWMRWGRIVVVLGFLAAMSSGAKQARGAEKPGSEPQGEESVLISTRDAANEGTPTDATASADANALEPIPDASERTPDLAIAPQGGKQDAGGNKEFVTPRIASREQQSQGDSTTHPSQTVQAGTSGSSTDAQASPFEPVKFQGILVGQSTRQQLETNWGDPDERVTTPEGDVLVYRLHPFEAVEVLVTADGIVSAIKVALSTPLDPVQLAKQLSLDQLRVATVLSEQDEPLGQAFPERGVLFMFDAADSQALAGDGAAITVSHVVVQPIAAQAFVMRAEFNRQGRYTECIDDLQTAISIDPKFAHAYYLLARIYLATGQADQADAAAAKACELEPDCARYQLCRSQTQELLGEYDAAVLTARAVLDREKLAQIEKAQALYQMARLASLGDKEIAEKAIAFHTRAIEIADKLATSDNGQERRAAKRLLIDAHMAMAEEIARQSFNDKIESLSQWIGRASGLAEEFITNDGGSIELRLSIAQRALGALATFRPTLDPGPWVAEAEGAAQALLAQSDDELWQARVKWDLGVAYFNALRVEHVRRETATALKYGQLAVDNLADGAATRQAVHSSEQLAGQLYFQLGAVFAVHQLDHKKAVQWYDKAEALLTGPRPVSDLYSPRREGEMLVSMGVTYWQLGEQARALQLTQSGVNLVEMAVEDGVIARTALAVPYGNLATMYKDTGETKSAAKYAELARSISVPRAAAQPKVDPVEGPSRASPRSARRLQGGPMMR